MKYLPHFRSAVFTVCAVLLSGCGPKAPAPVRIISARELLTAEDCAAYYKLAFQRANESFMGHNPPTLERDHVTMLDYESQTGDRVHLTLDQSVSIEESKKRVKDHRDAYAKEAKFREVPGFGDSGGWQVGNGGINFSRPPYRVRVEASGLGAPSDDAKSEEAVRHFAKIVDERLKKFAP
jgi:hypothetical protein